MSSWSEASALFDYSDANEIRVCLEHFRIDVCRGSEFKKPVPGSKYTEPSPCRWSTEQDKVDLVRRYQQFTETSNVD